MPIGLSVSELDEDSESVNPTSRGRSQIVTVPTRPIKARVPAHAKKKVTVSVPQRTTASVRVRVPEMGREELRLSTTVGALASCYVATVKPKASLGGVSCHGKDSVAQIVLDNRSTSDDKIAYTVQSSYGASSASFTVGPASSTNYYVPVPAERSTHVSVTAADRRVLSIDVAAASCP